MPQEDNNEENNEEQAAPASMSLDDVHAQALSEFDTDDTDDSDDNTDEDDKGQDDSKDDEDKGDDSDDDSDDSDDEDDDSEEEAEEDEDDSEDEDLATSEAELKTEIETLEAIAEDKDIEKAGEYKVEFKGFDGKSYFVRNIADLPDDFEASSQKELMQNMEKLNEQRAKFVQRMQDTRKKAAEVENSKAVAQQVEELQAGWQKEIKALKLDDQDTINKVYSLMAKWNNKGTPIGSFTAAYEIFKTEKTDDKDKKDQKSKQKKNKGSRVMGSNASSKKSGPIENEMPFGTTLDELHNSVMSEFE